MLHVGLDLSRKRVDVCLISDQGELVDELAAPFAEDGLRRLSERVAAKDSGRVIAVVESMNGARFVHDTLEAQGWDVLVADAQRVKGLAPLACKTDKIDARVLAELSFRDLVPAIWLPDPQVRRERELARFRLHLSSITGVYCITPSVPVNTMVLSVPHLGGDPGNIAQANIIANGDPQTSACSSPAWVYMRFPVRHRFTSWRCALNARVSSQFANTGPFGRNREVILALRRWPVVTGAAAHLPIAS